MAIPFHDRRNSEVLYHGTNARLKVGDVVTPQPTGTIKEAIERGSSAWSKVEGVPHDVPMSFATEGLHFARHYADQAAVPSVTGRRQSKGRTPRVYTVEPVNPSNVIRNEGNQEVASTEGFKVTGLAWKDAAKPALTPEQRKNVRQGRNNFRKGNFNTGVDPSSARKIASSKPETIKLPSVEDIIAGRD